MNWSSRDFTNPDESGCKILIQKILAKLQKPGSDNLFNIRYELLPGATIDDLYNYTRIDKWFLNQLKEIVVLEKELYEYQV